MDTKKRPRLSAAYLCLLIAAAAVVAGLGVWAWVDSSRGWTAGHLEARIAAEIPADADRMRVERWFETHAIRYQYLPGRVKSAVGDQTIAELAGFKDTDISGSVRGDIRDEEANVDFMKNGRIAVYFFLNSDGEVVGHYVDSLIYSL